MAITEKEISRKREGGESPLDQDKDQLISKKRFSSSSQMMTGGFD
jgi:hypothetical protein